MCSLVFHSGAVSGQLRVSIRGLVKDIEGHPLTGATIGLADSSPTNHIFYISGPDGTFTFSNALASPPLIIDVSHVGYSTRSIILQRKDLSQDCLLTVFLTPTTTTLPQVTIRARMKANREQEDTIEFDSKRITGPQILKVEDLLRNIKGFVVDSRGQISFDGRPIEKILIDGDDLAGSAYRFISKNLTANAVDSIQVLNNYSDNRLLKHLEHSDKTAINLRIKKTFLNRLSGSVDVGAAFSNKKTTTENLFLLKSQIKTMALSNSNNTGDAADNNVAYQFGREEKSNGEITNEYPPNPIVRPAGIAIPALDDKYINRNNDRNYSLINSWRLGKNVRIRSLNSIGNENKISDDSAYSAYTVPDISQWNSKSSEKTTVSKKYIEQDIVINYDNQRNRTARIAASYIDRGALDRYSNYLFTTNPDSLRERLHSKLANTRISVQETFKLKKYVLTIQADLTATQFYQALLENTKRLIGYFGVDSSLDNAFQFSIKKTNQETYIVRCTGKTGKLLYNYGAHLEFARLESGKAILLGHNENISSATLQSRDSYDYRTNQQNLFLHVSSITGKQIIELDFKFGYGKQSARSTIRSKAVGSFLNKSTFAVTRHLTPLKNLTFSLNFETSLPDPNLFHQPGILSGNATIENGTTSISPIKIANASLSYSSKNLLSTLKFIATGSYNISFTEYAPTYNLSPAYTGLGWVLAKNNYRSTVSISLEKYIQRLKGKIITSSEATTSRMSYIANNKASLNNSELIRTQFQYVSTFQSIANIELSFTALYSNMIISSNGTRFSHGVFQYEGYNKIKLRWSEKMYSNVLYGLYFFNRTTIFQTMDAYFIYRLNSRWTVSTTIHNLLNKKYFVSRSQSSNVETLSSFAVINRYLLGKIQFDL